MMFIDGGPGRLHNLYGDDGNDTLTVATSEFGGAPFGGAGNDVLIASDVLFSFNDLQGEAGDDHLYADRVPA